MFVGFVLTTDIIGSGPIHAFCLVEAGKEVGIDVVIIAFVGGAAPDFYSLCNILAELNTVLNAVIRIGGRRSSYAPVVGTEGNVGSVRRNTGDIKFCQSALKFDPPSASKIDPPQRLILV